MTTHRLDGTHDNSFRFNVEDQGDPQADALSSASQRLIEASKELRRRSEEMRNEMMRKLSV